MSVFDETIGGSFFEEMCVLKEATSRRISSWDRLGGNRDFIMIPPGATAVLADIKGAGCIRHIYFTISCMDIMHLRTAVLRMYWDGEKKPSVEVPVGDFFGIPFGSMRYFTSLMLTVNPGRKPGGTHGLNCYFPMPFSKEARITFENEGEVPIQNLWYHVEFDEYGELPANAGRFHAHWRRENPCEAVKFKEGEEQANLDGKENYVILEAKGQGNYVGCLLQVDNLKPNWYGEGDDMIFVDGDEWPPRYHGTGTEEIFGGGSCPNREYFGPYSGFHVIENRDEKNFLGHNAMYRFYVHDPVRFKKSIRVTVEHGHANNLANDYASVAYWYQSEPHGAFPELLPAEERIPRLPKEGVEARKKVVGLQRLTDARGGWGGMREHMGTEKFWEFVMKVSVVREELATWRFGKAVRNLDEIMGWLKGAFPEGAE